MEVLTVLFFFCSARYSYTAYADAVYNAFAPPPANFEMTPTETTAVA